MKYKKFNKYEKKEVRRTMIQNAMSGGGVYLYRNSSKCAELTLPRPTHSGVRKVEPNGEFQGDDYYMQMVKTGDLRLVEVLQTAEQEKEVLAQEALLQEGVVKEETQLASMANPKGGIMSEQKLIVEQPNRVTTKGTTEQVVQGTAPKKAPTKKPLKEAEEKKAQPADVLLNESPVDDGFVIVQ
jgi:hypothetical protein